MALVTFNIPEELEPLVQQMRIDAENLPADYPLDVRDFLSTLSTGTVTCEASMAEKLGLAFALANIWLVRKFGHGAIEVQAAIRSIAEAVWTSYNHEEKLYLIRAVFTDMNDIANILDTLVNSYGAPEAEAQALITEIVSEETWESGLD